MKAGWIVALVYLLCIMAPTLSYALPGGAAVPCATMQDMLIASSHMHGETAHDHSMHMMSNLDDRSERADDVMSDNVPSEKGAHIAGGQCCALMCIGGMPASFHDVTLLAGPSMAAMSGVYRMSVGTGPSVNDRPPIA